MAEKELKLVLKVDDQGTIVLDKFTSKIVKAGESISSMDRSLKLIKWDAFINLAQKAYGVLETFYSSARSIADMTNAIKRQADIVGLSTNEFQKWAYAAKMSDLGNEEFSIGLKRLTMSMSEAAQSSGDGYKAFLAMGLSATDASGKLKPLDQMMKEVAGKFAQWKDGPEKIALALTIFGRSGAALIPLLNQGADGISKYFKELENLRGVIDPKLIEAGSKAEDAFKRIATQMEAGKLRLAPYALGFANLIESMLGKLNELRAWVEKNPGIWGYIIGAIIPAPVNIAVGLLGPKVGKSELEKTQDEYLKLEEYYKRIGERKPTAPGMVDPEAEAKRIKALLDANKDWRDSLGKQAIVDERMAWAWLEPMFTEQEQLWLDMGISVRDASETFDQMLARQKALKEVLESSVPIYEAVKEDWGAIGNELIATASAYGITIDELLRIRDVLDSGIKDNAHFVDSLKEISTTWNDFGRTIADNFNTMFVDTLTGGFKNVADVFKKFCNSLLNSFVSAIGKMMIEWTLFETTTTGGETKKSFLGGGSGILKGIGTIAGLFGGAGAGPEPLRQFQHGGIVTRPTFSMIGEAGPEAVIPLRGGKIPIEGGKKGDTYITYIEATDVDSFSRKYGPVIEGIYFRGKRFNRVAMR